MPRDEIRLATSMPRGTQPTPSRTSASRPGRLRNFALGGLLAASLTMAALASSAQAASSVPLGTAAKFTVLAGTTVTSTGPTEIDGDVGVSPGTSVTGFPPGKVCPSCEIHRGDAVASKAQDDLRIAYKEAAGQSTTESPVGGDLTGRVLAPGVYSSNTSLKLNGTLTLDARGDPNAVFVFQAGSSLLVGVRSKVELIGQADSRNVFWQVGSSATIDPNTAFSGDILALTSITLKTATYLDGRALALNGAVTLDGGKGVSGPVLDPIPVPSNEPRALRYVALGDSFSSGEGLGEKSGFPPYLKGGAPGCHRHRLAYPSLFRWQGRITALDFFACSGARTEHIDKKTQRRGELVPQAKHKQLNKLTDLVTITIGGNDAGGPPGKDGSGGLGQALSYCYQNDNCQRDAGFRRAITTRLNALENNLRRSLRAIKRRTSQRNTAIVVLGYPRVFPTDANRKRLEKEQECAAFYRTFSPQLGRAGWDPGEQAFLNLAADRLNFRSYLVARLQLGVHFFDVTKTFTGHANCDRNGERWTNGLTDIQTPFPLPPIPGLDDYGPGSFHPNRAGQVAYRNILLTALRLYANRIKKSGGRLTPVGLPPNPGPARGFGG